MVKRVLGIILTVAVLVVIAMAIMESRTRRSLPDRIPVVQEPDLPDSLGADDLPVILPDSPGR